MPGYNHYPDCTCGWCSSQGRTIDRASLKRELARSDAVSFLKRNNASERLISCYVNPNARCPVCSANVYFYANRFGSRVYFDSLGYPWPKHPCTDKPGYRGIATAPGTTPPVKRARGLTKELLQAAVTAGLTRRVPNEERRDKSEWALGLVTEVKQTDINTSIQFELVQDEDQKAVRALLTGGNLAIKEGDFISVKGNVISVLDKETLASTLFPIQFPGRPNQATAYKAALLQISKMESEAKKNRAPEQKKTPDIKSKTTDITEGSLIRKSQVQGRKAHGNGPSKNEMTQAEMKHFHTSQKDIVETLKFYGPIVKSLAKAGVRKPRDVAKRLRSLNHRTASGSEWTPRLTYFLLALIFSDDKPKQGRADMDHKAWRATTPASDKSNQAENPLNEDNFTIDEMVRRLSLLGRVTVHK